MIQLGAPLDELITKNAPIHVVPEIFCSEKSLGLIGHACPFPNVIVTLTCVAQADVKVRLVSDQFARKSRRLTIEIIPLVVPGAFRRARNSCEDGVDLITWSADQSRALHQKNIDYHGCQRQVLRGSRRTVTITHGVDSSIHCSSECLRSLNGYLCDTSYQNGGRKGEKEINERVMGMSQYDPELARGVYSISPVYNEVFK